MISIRSKNKILLFDVSTEGIDRKNLEFWFRIYSENITYSFKGEMLEENKVKIVILPLTEMVKSKYLDTSKIYEAKLEVIGEDRYNLVTWEGEIKLETPPRIDTKLENVQEEVRAVVIKEEVKNPKKIIKNKTPAKIKVSITEVIEEDSPIVEQNKLDTVVKKIEKHQIEESDKELEELAYTRTSLLEDILGTPKKKTNVITKINDLIKE